MAYLGPVGRKWALILHLLCMALWLGSAIAMMTIAILRPNPPQTGVELAAHWLAIKLIDDFVIIGSAGGSLLTGLFLSWKTKWGFFQWYWVAFKLIATVGMVIFGATFLGPWIDATAAAAQRHGLAALEQPEYSQPMTQMLIWGTVQIVLLIAIVVISIFKPWGKVGG
jgi:hypothetical protein